MTQAARTDQQSPAAEAFDVVHARILRFFPDLVAELGGEPDALMRQVGLDPEELARIEDGVTYRQAIELIERAAIELQCPDFGMRLAMLQRGGEMFGPLGLVMQHSRTLGDALDYVSGHTYAHSLAARIWLRPCPEERTVFVGHDILLDRLTNRSQAMEQILLIGHLVAKDLTGGYARARRIHFRHQPIVPLKTYRRYFGCEIGFGQNEDGVLFAERDLARPIVDPDAGAYRTAAAYIEAEFTRYRPPVHAQTRGIVMRYLGTGYCTNERVAAELNMHPRTLHRRLGGEGTSFQKIKDEVRRDIMLYYLRETDMDFAYISEKLGFAEQSVMSRCSIRWFSASPTSVRARSRHVATTD
jgi:AraC-like DNA-binding protein